MQQVSGWLQDMAGTMLGHEVQKQNKDDFAHLKIRSEVILLTGN